MKKQLFTRAQTKNISLEAMQEYRSIHGWDEEKDDYLRVDGLACCNGIPASMNFGGANADDEICEIVVFTGRWIENIYDGCVAYPTEIVARIIPSEFERLVDTDEIFEMFSENDYEF